MRIPAVLRLALLAAAFVLTACEPPFPITDKSGVRVASPVEVTACNRRRVLTTTPGISGSIGRDKAMELARNETKANAADAGANTIVYQNGAPGSNDLFVRADAYFC
jgi:hypothetical protein